VDFGARVRQAGMERRFSIEAKSFCFSARDGFSDFRLEERRKNFVGFIFTSSLCASWLVETVEAACQVKEDVARSYREGDKVLMVHGGANKAGRFLEVSEYAEGGRKGVLWLPEGRFGRGWRRFAGELRLMLVPSDDKVGSKVSEPRLVSRVQLAPSKHAGVGVSAGCTKDRSFVEVLQSKPQVVLEDRSHFEAEKGGVTQRFGEEDGLDVSVLAAGSARKKGGNPVKVWVNQLLGFVSLGMGRVVIGLLDGLLNGPDDISVRKRLRAVLKVLKGSKGFGAGPASTVFSAGPGFPLKSKRVKRPYRRVSPSVLQPPSSRQKSDHLGAPEDVPSESARSAGFGSAPGIVLSMDSAPVSSSVHHAAFADAGSGSSPDVRQFPPVSPLMEAALSQADAPISQTCLVTPEPAVVESSALVHNCGFAVDGSSMGDVSLSDSKMVSNPAILEALSIPREDDFPVYLREEMSGSGVEVSVEAPVEISPAITPSTSVPAVSVAGLEPLGSEDPGDSSVQGIGSVPVPVELTGEKTLALVSLPVEQDPAEESDLITVVAPPDDGDGSSQMSRPGFSVPFAEEFLEFLPAGSLNMDWQDFFSSLHTVRRGMSDSELIKEAFALPWEVDEPASPSCRDKEASSSGDEGGTQMERPPAPMKSLLRRGFLGPRNVSPHPVVLKEVLPVIKTSDISTEDEASSISGPVILPSLLEDKQGVHSTATIVLPSSKVCASSNRYEVTESNPINSSVSWYNRRVKGKVAKQLNKNKELIAEAVGVLPVGGGDRVSDALNLAPVLGLSWRGEDKKLRDIIEATVPKVKGMRELKNLECDISPVKDKRRRGWSGSKNARSFPPEVH
jgi:hypothetical protein